jgi:pimeloyl-ACP methyl ester carboxylesterase
MRRFGASGGVSLSGDAYGEVHGKPAVLLLHGGGQTRHSWGRAAIELCTRGYYVLALDLRGHGDSDWAPVISLVVAGEASEPAIRALVLGDVTPQVDPAGRTPIIGFMRDRPDGFGSLEEAADVIARYLPHRPRPKDLSGLHRNLRRHADGRWYWHWDPRFFDTFEPDHEAAAKRYTAAAVGVKVPTLLVRGTKSELVTPENVRHFRESIPHAEYVDVADAAHMIAGDRNDVFNEVVLDFLQRHVPPSLEEELAGQ